jgi:hypothetical protein
MNYKESPHLKSFTDEIGQYLLELDSFAVDSHIKKNMFLCSCILLTSARFEKYLESILDSWGAYINYKSQEKKGLKNVKVPHNTRMFKLLIGNMQLYRKFLLENNEVQTIKDLQKNIALMYLADDKLNMQSFRISQIYADKKYPSPKNLQKLFFRLGIDNIFDEISKKLRKDSKKELDSFNSVRTSIAHEAQITGLSLDDIKAKLTSIIKITEAIDIILFDHFKSHTGAESWKYISKSLPI